MIKGIIFTDLDESLLNENKYDGKVLDKYIRKLLSENFFIIALTSKTYKEVISLYKENNIKLPFSSENGAAFYIPRCNKEEELKFKKILNRKSVQVKEIEKCLNNLNIKYPDSFLKIKDLNIEDQMKITSLNKEQLLNFYKRDFSVSLLWNSSTRLLNDFNKNIESYNLKITFGGKMFNISGNHNKLDALKYFEKFYENNFDKRNSTTISIGDSQNDIEILNYTDYSGIVRRKDKKKIKLLKSKKVYKSKNIAPKGWIEVLNLIRKDMEDQNG